MSRFLSAKLDTDRELAMMALIASDTPEEACEYLKTEHNLMAKPSHLAAAVRMRPKEYEELRQKVAPLKEKTLAHNLLDNALYASEVTAQAMQHLRDRIEEGRIKGDQLSRVARDLADVQAKAVDKKLALEGRPTVITEQRNAAEIIRALEQKGVVRQIEVTSDS